MPDTESPSPLTLERDAAPSVGSGGFFALCMRHPRKILLALCLLLYVPGMFVLPPLDRDEARFVQSSKQMADSGDYINIWFQDEPRHKKPVGIYWLQSASAKLFGERQIASYRLVSLLAAIGSVLSLFYWLRRFTRQSEQGAGGERIAFIASVLLATCLGLTLEAHQAKTDAALLLCIITMQGALLTIWASSEKQRLVAYVYWAALGAALLIKGPVALLVGGLTMLTLIATDKSLGIVWKMRPVSGAVLAAMIVAPWLYAIQTETGGAFLSGGYAADVLPKLLGGVESHGAPPGYYLLLLPAFFWPAIAFLIPAIPSIWRARSEPLVMFALAWLIPSWIVMELIPTKLPHYVLPTYPALAILAAYGLTKGVFSKGLSRVGQGVWLLIGLVLCAALLYFPLHLEIEIPWHAYWVSALGLALLLAAFKRLRYAVAFQLLMFGYIFQVFLPSMNPMWISRQLQQAVTEYEGYPIAMSGYHEPSAVFLLGTQTKLTSVQGVADQLNDHGGIGIVANVDAFSEAMGEGFERLSAIGEVSGLNYAKGKAITLTLYERKQPEPSAEEDQGEAEAEGKSND